MELTIEQALQQAVAAHKEGKLPEAERLYRAILQAQPTHPDANHNLGVLAVAVNKAEAALPLFKTALEVDPKIEQFWLSYIDALIKEKQFVNAQKVIERGKAEVVNSENLNALEEKLKSNTLTPSQQQLNNLLEHYQHGRYEEAETLAVLITQQFPKHQLGWKILGALFRRKGKKEEALNTNQEVVKLVPQDAEAHSNLGVTLQELGKLEDAEASYIQAITLKSDFAEAHFNLGITLKELGRLDEAEASYAKALIFKPDYAEAYNDLGIILQELGRLDEAQTNYTQAIALKPDYAEAHNNLGVMLKELGKLDEAEARFTQAIALKSNYFEAMKNRGLVLFDKKKFGSALKDFDLSNTKVSRAHALSALYALGRTKEIYERIEAQLEVDEKNLRVAAFSSFVSEVQKKDTAHTFCNNPLDFLYFSDISSHCDDSELLMTELINDLLNIEKIWEPTGKTTRKGFQSKTHINLFKNSSTQVEYLKSIIIDELDLYYSKFKKDSCSYVKNWPTEINLQGWYVILKEQGYQGLHIHPGGWLSGVIYLKVVPSLGKHEGAIEFTVSSPYYTHTSSSKIIYEPKLGDIVFFPSSLHHRTIPFTTNTDRIIVSFDLMPN